MGQSNPTCAADSTLLELSNYLRFAHFASSINETHVDALHDPFIIYFEIDAVLHKNITRTATVCVSSGLVRSRLASQPPNRRKLTVLTACTRTRKGFVSVKKDPD